ncbi:MAG: acyl carrier protein [Deltaproteobacteria bacterium]|nr:acyl carrier protein [Deltaproteobacteria bacterium]
MELKEEILEKIIQRASTLFQKDPGELNADTKWVEDLNAKSVNYVQIITILADEYDVEINFMEFRRKKTFSESAEFVAQLCGG